MSQVNPNARAFPSGEQWTDIAGNSNGKSPIHPGITVRAHFASLALQGLLASPIADRIDRKGTPPDRLRAKLAWESVAMADALIAELNK